MRFAFVGAPEFAARVLTQLDEIGRRPCLVVSQPDRPKGRGRKTCAASCHRRLLGSWACPSSRWRMSMLPSSVAAIAASGATTLVVAAFGQILSPATLQRFLCLNVHASLLPRIAEPLP